MKYINKNILLVLITIFLSGNGLSQKIHVLKTKFLPVDDSINVFVPENYNYQNKYPLVILLHGYSGNYKTWNKFTPLQEYATKYQFIIVCPDGLFDSWYINSPKIKSIQYENFFFMRLMPFIFRNYSVDMDNIFITGLSMGGFGSLYLFSTHPKLFKTAGSTSGLIIPKEFVKDYGISKIMGENCKNYSILRQIDKFKNLKYSFIIDCGTEDQFYKQNIELNDSFINNNIPVSFSTSEGTHNRKYWKKTIINHFIYFNSLINN